VHHLFLDWFDRNSTFGSTWVTLSDVFDRFLEESIFWLPMNAISVDDQEIVDGLVFLDPIWDGGIIDVVSESWLGHDACGWAGRAGARVGEVVRTRPDARGARWQGCQNARWKRVPSECRRVGAS
jgi:hypothetical protein